MQQIKENKSIIQVKELSKKFKIHHQYVEILKNVSFTVFENDFVSIIGPSGCGKSTLLRIISGLTQPTSGQVFIEKKSPLEYRKEKNFGFVFQDAVLFPWRDSQKNVMLPLEILRKRTNKQTNKQQEQEANKFLELVKLRGFEKAYPVQLSGGMRQRVSIARALVYNPSILLMDEPFGALDEMTRQELNLELLRIWDDIKTTIIFVTHNIREAIFLSDHIILLSEKPAQIKNIFKVNLPRPRTVETLTSLEFQNQLEKITVKGGN